MVEWQSADQKVRGSIPRSAKISSIYLNEELKQKVNKKKKKKNNNKQFLGLWPMAKDKNWTIIVWDLVNLLFSDKASPSPFEFRFINSIIKMV